jgi:hypothetical protein
MNTLRLSLPASLSILALACGTTDDSIPPPPTTPADTGSATQPPAPPQKRTLVDGSQLATSPVNLLFDPGFSLVNIGESSYGMWLDQSLTQGGLTTTLDSRSPAGFGGGVGLFQADGATNKESLDLLFVAPFQGGDGPFHAQVWVSKSDIGGKPVAFTADAKSITASLSQDGPNGDAVDLKPVDGANKTVGGRTWVLLQADYPQPLPYGGYFLIHTGGNGGRWHVAAPSVVAKPLLDGLTTQSFSLGKPVIRRITAAERRAMESYRSMKPKLVPAASKQTKRSSPLR